MFFKTLTVFNPFSNIKNPRNSEIFFRIIGNILNIEMSPQIKSFSIYDINGKILDTRMPNSNIVNYNLKNYSSGCY